MARMRAKYGKDQRGRKYLKYYYADFFDKTRHPKRKKISLGTRDEVAARQKFAVLERRCLAGLWDPWTNVAPQEGTFLSSAIEQYQRERERAVASGDLSKRTVRADGNVLGLFRVAMPPGFQVEHVEERHVRGFLDRLDLKPSSYNTYLARLSGFFSWCSEQGHVRNVASSSIRQRKGSRSSRSALAEYLTRDEHERLLRAIEADAVLKPVAGEALEILRRRYEQRTSEANAYVFQGRRVQKRDREKLNEEYVSKRFLYYRRLARLPEGITFHNLRHTYASWLVIAGVDLYRVKELLGHKSIESTMRYSHLAPHNIKGGVKSRLVEILFRQEAPCRVFLACDG
ncbi:MAG: tyrosine-type recombinase/integrase [Rhodothermales bacterium]